jgi:uncharacterized BrkB/YihY/UPF0761 family membrane protein
VTDEGADGRPSRGVGEPDTDATASPPGPRSQASGGVQRSGWRDRIGVITRRLKRDARVQELQAVLAGADAAGGALLAAGLAFHALFAILPALLFLTGIAGWLIQDPQRRAQLISDLVDRVPPLSGPLSDALEQLAAGAGAFSLVGLIGLGWGASNFYGSLDEAMRRLFPGGTARTIIEQRLRGLATVLGLILVVVLAVLLGGVWQIVEGIFAGMDDVGFWRLVSPVLTFGLFILAVLVTYLVVPTAPPGWRTALPPATVAGAAIGVLTSIFTLIAPSLVGALSTFGVGVIGIALFGALIWLNYAFTFLIFGASWARVRRDREALRHRAPHL